jgi:hypothetical protein
LALVPVPAPAPPVRQYSFTDFQVNNPTTPPPGDRMDAEYDRANASISAVINWVEVSLSQPPTDPGDSNADNHAEGFANLASDYADVTQAWAEHMPDTIPPNILAVMNVTGDHWSSRWWANQAALTVTKAYGALNYRGAWNPVTNTPVLASGGLSGGAVTQPGDYYVASVSGTSVAIDGLTTWVAGDFIISTGVSWQRAQTGAQTFNYIATGAVTLRAAQDRAVEAWSVKDWGAVGNTTTNDSAAFQAALVAVAAGGKIFVPAGVYNIGSALSQAITGAVTFEGAGSGVTILNFSNPTDGLAFNLSATANVHVRGMTIARTAAGAKYANTGLTIAMATAAVQQGRLGLVSAQDVQLKGNSTRTSGWATSLNLNNVSGVALDHIGIVNPDANGVDAGVGILWAGQSGSSYAVDSSWNDISIQGGSIGISVGNYVQGVYLTQSRIIGVDYGISWPGPTGIANLWINVVNCHFNAGTRGIYATRIGSVTIANTLSLHFAITSVTGDWAGFEIDTTYAVALSNNLIRGRNTGTENGIILSGSNTTQVTGNYLATLSGNGIVLISMTQVSIVGNLGAAIGGVLISNVSGNTLVHLMANQDDGVPTDVAADLNGNLTVVGSASAVNLNASGGVFVGTATAAGSVIMQGPNASTREIQYFTGAQSGADFRWGVGVTANAESGGNTGSDFHIRAISDTGAQIGTPLIITRATGLVTFSNQIAFSGAALPTNATNDAAAASAGVSVGGVYRNGSALMVRVA